MFRTFRLGTFLGFPIEVNLSFLILLGVVALTMGGLAGVAVMLLAFTSVLLHELGHALVARHLGVRVAGIELHFFGGAAKIIDRPRRPGDEIAIAAAGPAVSFALAGMSLLAAQLGASGFFAMLAWINLAIGAFNLIPALPMDGGRILRALLVPRMGMRRATQTSVTIARGFAIALGLYAVVAGQVYLALLAVLLWIMSGAELRAVEQRDWFERVHGGGLGPDDGDEVEVLPRGAFRGAREGARRIPVRRSPLRPFWAGGFVVRRDSRGGIVIEPRD